METRQVSFHLPADAHREFEDHLKRMGGTKSGVLRSLIHDWMAWRTSATWRALKEHESRGAVVDFDKATVDGKPLRLAS